MALADTIITRAGPQNPDGSGPKYAVIRPARGQFQTASRTTLVPSWIYSYSYQGRVFHESFIGAGVATGVTTTVPVYLIPIALTYGGTGNGSPTNTDPTMVTANGVSLVQNIVNSPIFSTGIDFKAGGSDLGNSQYIDAFQRANLWSRVKAHPTYHVLLGSPMIEPVQTLTVPASRGAVMQQDGQSLVVASLSWFDQQVQPLIAALGIPSNALPLFVTTGAYLSENNGQSGCCVGGYHSALFTGQGYAFATYLTQSGQFAEDVDALSHEIGEWVDDPQISNPVPPACGFNATLEVGDPLEGAANYGTYPYVLGGVTWHLQNLVFLPYFGAPAKVSVNGWSSFQGTPLAFCSAGG
jgi:hypothetical protein